MRFDPNGSVFVLFRPLEQSEPEHLISLTRNGAPLLQTTLQPQQPATAQTNQDMASTFTMALWAKPEVEIDLPSEAKAGSFGWHVLRNEALFPPPGHDVYSRPGQAGSGLSIGSNLGRKVGREGARICFSNEPT